MDKLEKAYYTLQQMEIRGDESPAVDPRVDIGVCLLFLVLMLSVPLGHLSMLIWFALYPIIASAYVRIGFGEIFRKSLYVLPLIALIGIFNPFIDREPAFFIGNVAVSRGWVSFVSIVLRGMMAVQAILILIRTCGFLGLCRGLRRLWVPTFLTDQLEFVYRYMSVLLLEAMTMKRAREARGFGRKRFPLKIWKVLIGQLFLRSIDRAVRVHRAMLARGFNGTLPQAYGNPSHIRVKDILYLLLWGATLFAMRFADLSALFHFNNINI